MKRLAPLVLALFLPFLSIGQSLLDSLLNRLNSGNIKASNEVQHTLGLIAYEYSRLQQYDSALRYYERSVDYPLTPENKAFQASSYNGIGQIYSRKGYLDKSQLYYQKALLHYTELNDTANIINLETNLAMIYKDLGQYEKALETSFDVLTKLEKRPADKALAACLNTIGSIYLKISDPQSALSYYFESLDVRKKIKYEKGIGQSYNNIGDTYMAMQQYDSALKHFLKASEIKKQVQDFNSLPNTLNNIAHIYILRNQTKIARPILSEALELRNKYEDREGMALILNSFGRLELLERSFTKAGKYLVKAEQLCREAGVLEKLKENLDLQIELARYTGETRIALKLADELFKVKDSLLNKEKAESLMAVQARFESEKKESQIALLTQQRKLHEAEITAKKFWIIALVIISSLIALGIIIIWYQYHLLQKSKRHADLLLRELHHRVKNNLQILSSIFSLQAQTTSDEVTQQAIKSSEGRVNAMALIHRKLYHVDSNRTVNMKDYITELTEYLVHMYERPNKLIHTKLVIEEVELDVDKAIPAGLILNELISNALKYGIPSDGNPELEIKLVKQTAGIHIRVSDNGDTPGWKEDSLSFGLSMVKILTTELKGTISSERNHGTTIQLQIPI